MQAEAVWAEIKTAHDDVSIIKGKTNIGTISPAEIKTVSSPFVFKVNDDTVEVVQFELIITDSANNSWTESIEMPICNANSEFLGIVIADGKEYNVADAGDKTAIKMLGTGNGDGIANPGETIAILLWDKTENIYRRNHLYTANANINPLGINLRRSNYWGRYDSVGGSEKSSLALIASNCPEGTVIDFFAEHWIPERPYHRIKRGKVSITVSGSDTSPPETLWVKALGDNTLQAKVYDGDEIVAVRAKLSFKETPFTPFTHETIELSLNDNGEDGDRVAGDNIFSVRIPEQKFGIFQAEISARDANGNSAVKSFSENIILH